MVSHFVPSKNSFTETKNNMCIGFVSSIANLPHLEWFITNVWGYFQKIDRIELNIYGTICDSRLVQQYKNKDNLFFKGIAPDIQGIYQNINIVINPIRFGSGLKIKNIEALAHGIPLITTDTGMQGIDSGANNAFLVANTVDDAILMCKSSPTLCKMLSQSALGYCKRHFSENVYEPLINILKSEGEKK